MEIGETGKKIWRVAFLLILVGILLGVLTWTGIIKCSLIPGWCDVYYGILRFSSGGQAKVAIVYGEDGLGEPEVLAEILSDPRILGVHPTMLNIENLELGNIRGYDLVIVERAKTIETKKLDIFLDYINKHGGRLVWTGDAGTRAGRNDRLLSFQQRQGTAVCEDVMKAKNLTEEDIKELNLDCIFQKDAEIISPWARIRDDDSMLNFDQPLGVNYLGNFCELSTNLSYQSPEQNKQAAAKCFQEKRLVGRLIPEATKRHPLILGMRTDLGYYGDFAVVEEQSGNISTRALSIQFDSKLVVQKDSNKTIELGNILPMIQTTGIGERVAYYAVPPEQFAKQPMNYISIAENMYTGMIRG